MCFKNCNVLFCKGNQTCSRCHKLDKELGALKGEMEQIKLKQNEERTLIAEKLNRIATLRETNGRHDPVQEYGLEQVIEKEREEKRHIESRLLSEKSAVEKRLQEHKEHLVEVKRQNERLTREIKAHLNKIKELENSNKALVTNNKNENQKIKTVTTECDKLKAECSVLYSEKKRLVKANKESLQRIKDLETEKLQKIEDQLEEKIKTLEKKNDRYRKYKLLLFKKWKTFSVYVSI